MYPVVFALVFRKNEKFRVFWAGYFPYVFNARRGLCIFLFNYGTPMGLWVAALEKMLGKEINFSSFIFSQVSSGPLNPYRGELLLFLSKGLDAWVSTGIS